TTPPPPPIPTPTPPPIPTPTPPPPPIPTPTPPPIPTPTPPPPPIPTPTPPPIPTPIPPPIPTPTSPPPPPPETEPTTDEHIYEEQSPVHHHFSPSQEQAPSHMPMDDLLQAVPKLISRIDSLEMDLKQTKLTMGNAIVKLVKKVKKLEGFMKRRNLVLTDSEEEEPEAQGRKSQDDPQDSSVQGLVTPPTTKVNTSGEEQVEEISPNTLEAAKTLSKVASLKPRSIDKGRRYKRRKETKVKTSVTSIYNFTRIKTQVSQYDCHMAQLKYCDKHNQVGFLRKPDESTGFAEIVDFLRGSNLRYALTANPTIYDSLVKQFWQSAITTSNTDGSLEISATIDTIRYTISEASIRDSLQLDDATGITMLPNADLFEGMGQIGYPTDGTFTFWKSFFTPQWRFLVHHLLHCISSKSGGWDQFGSNIATALICLSTGRVYNFSKLIFDGMVANLKSKTKFLMYPRFLQMILNIQTENKTLYLAVSLTKKIFGNMKRGFRGAPRPLLPSMLLVATNPIAGQEHAAVAQSQPSSSTPPTPTPPPIPTPIPPPIPTPIPPPIPTPIPPPIPTPIPPPIPTPTSPPPPPPETEPTTDEHIYEEQSPVHHHFSPSQAQAPSHMPMDDVLQAVPKLISRIDSL
ncbi:hypothetical protein Tco_0184517, partial [Tanacetum coccineum]